MIKTVTRSNKLPTFILSCFITFLKVHCNTCEDFDFKSSFYLSPNLQIVTRFFEVFKNIGA